MSDLHCISLLLPEEQSKDHTSERLKKNHVTQCKYHSTTLNKAMAFSLRMVIVGSV